MYKIIPVTGFICKSNADTCAANALHRHICRFGVPTELITDQGTQFVNETFTEYLNVADVQKKKHYHIQKKITVLLKGQIKNRRLTEFNGKN